MSKKVSVSHSAIKGRRAGKQFNMTEVTDAAVMGLARLGIVMDSRTVMKQISELYEGGDIRTGVAMDSNFTAPVTTGSVPTPIQFLQNWLPGFVKVMTAARKIDTLIGVNTVGNWEDEEIVQGIVEPAATAVEYGDHTNVPLASWNANFERRTVVRGEIGMNVGLLEEGRSSAMRLNSAETKRQSAAIALEIMRNAIGFFGWRGNSGISRTFGFLNDPNFNAMITAPSAGAGGWAAGDFQAIQADIRAMVRQLRTQSQDNFDPEADDVCLALPTNKIDFLSVTTDFGISVRNWIEQTYKKMRIESAPELQGYGTTIGTDDVAYMYIEDIDSSVDGSTDDGSVFSQLVPTKFITLGVEKRAKSYIEDYSSATAGTLCKRPWAVVRFTGI